MSHTVNPGGQLGHRLPPHFRLVLWSEKPLLVDAQCDYIPVRMVNLTNEPRQIPSGIEVAICEPVESIVYPSRDPRREPISPDEGLPEHLKDLYLRSTKGLTNDQQHQLCTLLLEFQDIFSRGPHDLCRTGVTKHKINTSDTPPVCQHPRTHSKLLRRCMHKA